MRLQSQNLVPNGSFEEFYSCPWTTGQVDTCLDWQGMGGFDNLPQFPGTPDYFASCAPLIISVPDNYFGSQSAFEGNAYVGIYTFDYVWWYREIIGTKLMSPIIPGDNYHISMRVSRGNWTQYATGNCVASNKIGIRFTNSPYSQTNLPLINNQAQLFEDFLITDTLNWVLLTWNFIPDSAYNYLYIGNFFDDAHTDTVSVNCPFPGHSYYFIDSLNVICTDENCFTNSLNVINQEINILYDHESKTIFLNYTQKVVFVLINAVGEVVLKMSDAGTDHINASQLSRGVYLAKLSTEQKIMVKKIFVY
ncbi:MAG: T9SS type A sorting domain-containing protein [Chitinophagales bacterium]